MPHPQHGNTGEPCQQKRHNECEYAEDTYLQAVFAQVFHVHLQTGKEHNVIHSHFSEQFEGVIRSQDIQTMLAHNDSCYHHTNDMRNTQLAHYDRSKQYDHQHDKENQCRVGDREIL